jgi:C4-dicarboxylate transporter DctQ subunit
VTPPKRQTISDSTICEPEPVTVRAAYDFVTKAATFAAFSIMLLAALAGTMARYLPFMPTIAWGEEVTRYAGIWSVFLVAGLGIRNGTHLGVDLLTRTFSRKLRRANFTIVYSLMMGFALLLLHYGVKIVVENTGQYSAALEWPMAWIYLCVPVGAVLMIVEIIPILLRLFKGEVPAHPTQEAAP